MWTVLLVSFFPADLGDEDEDDAKDLGLRVHAIPPPQHLRLLLPSDEACGLWIVPSAHGEQEPTVGYVLVPPCVVAMARGLTAAGGS